MRVTHLFEICRPKQWKTIASKDLTDEGYPVYGANGKIGFFHEYNHDKPTVLITCRGATCGTINISEPYAYINGNAMALDDMDETNADLNYVARYLSYRGLEDVISGSAQPQITRDGLKNLTIPLPPLPEQRRIAAILDKADALRAKRREAIAKLDQLLQSVFLEMFGDPVTNPKGWPVVSIQEACESIVDCVNRTAPTVDYVTDYKMIRTTNVRNFKVSLDSVRYVEKAVFDDWNRRLLPQRGDVILTREAPAGEAGILDSDDQVFLGQRLMLYRVSQQRATPEYLLYSFMGEGMQQQFKKHSSGSTVKHLSVPDCRSWDLMLPPVELQKKFTEIAASNWSLRQSALEHINRLEALFSSIQQGAFAAR